jgi:hypothetical protein
VKAQHRSGKAAATCRLISVAERALSSDAVMERCGSMPHPASGGWETVMIMYLPMDIQRHVEQRWAGRMRTASADARGSMVFARPAGQQPNQVPQAGNTSDPSLDPAPPAPGNSAIMDLLDREPHGFMHALLGTESRSDLQSGQAIPLREKAMV